MASVASTIAKHLGLNEQLAAAIALGHDIGHAPFGHFGEECLNKLLPQKPGENAPKRFWHERNSLFFADYIETLQDPEGRAKNLDLTYAVRDGIVCHCGEVDESGIRPRSQAILLYDIKKAGSVQPYTWEGCVVKLSDKIAYLGRDIEDARRYHILDMGAYRQLREIVGECFGFSATKTGKTVNTTVLINDLIVDLCQQSSPEAGVVFSPAYFKFMKKLKSFNFANIYNHWRLQEFEHYATVIIHTIYRLLCQTQPFVPSQKVGFCLKQYPLLSATFEDWLVKYTSYNLEKRANIKFDSIQPVFDLRHCRIVHPACLLLAVSADERNGRALLKHQGAVLDLPGLALETGSYFVDIELLHKLEFPEPQTNDSPKCLSENGAGHLRSAGFAVDEDYRNFLYAESLHLRGVFHLDLEAVALHLHCIQVNCAQHLCGPANETCGAVHYACTQDCTGIN